MTTYEPINSESRVGAFVWKRAGLCMNTWRLTCRERLFAEFTVLNPARTRGVLRTAAGEWIIEQAFGGVAPHVGVRSVATGRVEAVFRPSCTGNGRTDFAHGPTFRWRQPASNTRSADIVTLKGGPIATVARAIADGQGPIAVFLAADALHVPELPVLLGLGLCATLRVQRGEAARVAESSLADTVAMTG